MKKSILLLAALLVTVALNAQQQPAENGYWYGDDTAVEREDNQRKTVKRAWEIGIGGSVHQFNRIRLVDFSTIDESYYVNMQLRHVVWGGNLYAAKELSDVFALDFQGSLGKADGKLFAQAGLGLQWRLGSYFKSRYIDPYLRVGGNYMYKGFDIVYSDSLDGMNWKMDNNRNKEGDDGRHLFPIAAGVGVNMWLTDHLGIGMQADYLIIPKPNVANSLQGTLRLMWRIGGKPKKPAPAAAPEPIIEYVDVVVRDTVFVDREITVEVERENVYDLIRIIHFDLNKYELRPEYGSVIERVAGLMKEDISRRFLITGYTDIRGVTSYNRTLSYKRAEAIMNALFAHGVPQAMIKIKGVGNRVSHAVYGASDKTRDGDRKVTIELISNEDYWNIL